MRFFTWRRCRLRSLFVKSRASIPRPIIYIYIVVAPSRYTAVSIGWGWGRTMEITWPNMPW